MGIPENDSFDAARRLLSEDLGNVPAAQLQIGRHLHGVRWSSPFAIIPERATTPWKQYTTYINETVDASLGLPGLYIVGINSNHRILPGGIWSGEQRRFIDIEMGYTEALSRYYQAVVRLRAATGGRP